MLLVSGANISLHLEVPENPKVSDLASLFSTSSCGVFWMQFWNYKRREVHERMGHRSDTDWIWKCSPSMKRAQNCGLTGLISGVSSVRIQ